MSVIAARPVNEQIAQRLVERLELLTAGYSSYFVAPYVKRRLFHDTETPLNFGIVVTQGNDERVPELDCPGNPPALCFRVPFNIRCRIMPSETDTTPVDEYVNIIAAEVHRVVCDDSYLSFPWYTFEDLAFDAEISSPEYVDNDGSFDGVNQVVTVTYRVTEGNPWEVRA